MSHHWPGITPFNVWQLPFSAWVDFARQTDRELEAIRKANEGS